MTAEATFAALAEPRRRAMLLLVRDQPCSVSEIARNFDISQQAVSQHLKVLKHAGLVSDRPVANRRLYSLDPRGLDALRAYFERFWNHKLRAYKAAAEQGGEQS